MDPARLAVYKSLLRNKLRRRVRGIRFSSRARKSQKILSRVASLPDFRTAESILIYASLPDEVQTQGLIRSALKKKKSVYLPSFAGSGGTLSIFKISTLAELKRGKFGIFEPRVLPSRKGNPREIDLAIVPGVGFDLKGRRLGRGGGHFDRFLKKARRAKKIGLAFGEQILPSIPAGPHDVMMDKVISD